MLNIVHTQGDTFIRNLQFKDNLGANVDLTGSIITMMIKNRDSSSTAIITKLATIVSAV